MNIFPEPPTPGDTDLAPSGTAKNASPVPLILLLLAMVASGSIAFFILQLGGEWWSLIGYALTPLFGVVAVGWDALAQLLGRKNPWFVARPLLSRIIRIAAALSIAVGVIHIWRISEWVARTAVQQGWPFLT